MLTSSVGAMCQDVDESSEEMPITEECWNMRSSKTMVPYFYSKVLAERRAWEMAEAQSK